MSPGHNRQAGNSLANFEVILLCLGLLGVIMVSVFIFDASRDVRSDIDRAVEQIGTACQLEMDQ